MTIDYERGLAEGKISARLDDHDRRLERINGSIEKTADNLNALTLQIQALTTAVSALTEAGMVNEAARTKYTPIIEALERRRYIGIKFWHGAAIVGLVILPQTINLIIHL